MISRTRESGASAVRRLFLKQPSSGRTIVTAYFHTQTAHSFTMVWTSYTYHPLPVYLSPPSSISAQPLLLLCLSYGRLSFLLVSPAVPGITARSSLRHQYLVRTGAFSTSPSLIKLSQTQTPNAPHLLPSTSLRTFRTSERYDSLRRPSSRATLPVRRSRNQIAQHVPNIA